MRSRSILFLLLCSACAARPEKVPGPAADASKTAGSPPVAAPSRHAVPPPDLQLQRISVPVGDARLAMYAPPGAKVDQTANGTRVFFELYFQLDVRAGEASLAARRSVLEKAAAIVVESATDDAIVWRSEPPGVLPQHHFVAHVAIDGQTYHCEDAAGPSFGRESVLTMLKSCRTLAQAPE